MPAAIPHDETLADVLGTGSERTPTSRLLLEFVGGVLVGSAAIWARPLGWVVLATLSACIACYGAWALARRRARRLGAATAWAVVGRITGPLGVAAFIFLLFVLLGIALGTLIS